MKRVLVVLALGVAGALGMTGNAEAAHWTNCGSVQPKGQSDIYVWQSKGGCHEATATVKRFYKFYGDFLTGGFSAGFGRFGCDYDSTVPTPVLRCESDTNLILGLAKPASDPNKWVNPPAVTATLTRERAESLIRFFIALPDPKEPEVEKFKVKCPERISRITFVCHFSAFQGPEYFRGTARVTKTRHGSSGRFSAYRFFDRKCLRSGGTLGKCRLRELSGRSQRFFL